MVDGPIATLEDKMSCGNLDAINNFTLGLNSHLLRLRFTTNPSQLYPNTP
jgi:hypothetical protein